MLNLIISLDLEALFANKWLWNKMLVTCLNTYNNCNKNNGLHTYISTFARGTGSRLTLYFECAIQKDHVQQ